MYSTRSLHARYLGQLGEEKINTTHIGDNDASHCQDKLIWVASFLMRLQAD